MFWSDYIKRSPPHYTSGIEMARISEINYSWLISWVIPSFFTHNIMTSYIVTGLTVAPLLLTCIVLSNQRLQVLWAVPAPCSICNARDTSSRHCVSPLAASSWHTLLSRQRTKMHRSIMSKQSLLVESRAGGYSNNDVSHCVTMTHTFLF